MKSCTAWAVVLVATMPAAVAAETVKVNGVELHYSSVGFGEPLLLLHGIGTCAAQWNSFAKKFSAQYQVIAVDMRGHGSSTNPSGRFTHAESAEDVLALMDNLGIEKARAIGFSSGGMTLLHLATKHPDRLSRLVLIGATTHFPKRVREILNGSTVDTMPPPVMNEFRQCATRGEEQVRSLVDQFRAFGTNFDDMNFKAVDLSKIKTSTMIIHGDRDEFFPVSIPVEMYLSIKNSALWIVPKGGHSPTAGADKVVFENQIADFMAN